VAANVEERNGRCQPG